LTAPASAVALARIERVFAYGFAYTLDRDGWNRHLDGRVPLLTQRKGLIITPTFFTQEEYDRGDGNRPSTRSCATGHSRWRG
jgi:hypothetical protein